MSLREQALPGQYLKSLSPAELAVCDGADSFLQSAFWGNFKARFGWQARGFLAGWGAGEERPLLVLCRPLGPGVSFVYVPWGPELPGEHDAAFRQGALAELAGALRPFFRDAAFIRFDPPWYTQGAEAFPPLLEKPFTRAAADVQPPDSVLVDLDRPATAVLENMKPKGRYNIRLSAKKGVTLRRAADAELPVFYGLFQETARRDGIAIHSLAYYQTLFSLSREYPGTDVPGTGARPDVRLYIAREGGEDLAALIMLIRGRQAVYLYGASSDHKRNLMAPYGLQWKAMKEAQAAGCREYDLFGIPPRDDPSHPMSGLYRFKTNFGGTVIHRCGSWDYPYRPVMKCLFDVAWGIRKQLRSATKR
ncbi:MAG: peptidoglycan bridge formation glycyltransferase FemA/FemB family protein [Treponema sp.]|nr:peptidoglycan bridge formation glycyltransferase FemA/FemB family protein [Treponema sp.]